MDDSARQPRHHEALADTDRDRAVAYALGTLDARARKLFETHMQACGPCRLEVEKMSRVTGWLSLALPAATPPKGLRKRILALPRLQPDSVKPPSLVVREAEGAWSPYCPNVSVKPLAFDGEHRMTTVLLRMAPGSKLPPHDHSGPEQCFVMEGEVRMEGLTLRAGDYVRESTGSRHGDVYSETGCLLLVISCSAAASV